MRKSLRWIATVSATRVRFPASILFTLLLVAPAFAQQIPRCSDEARAPPISGCLAVQYDRFKDSTIAALNFTIVDKEAERLVVFSLMSSYAGNNPAGKDRSYALAIVSVGTKVQPAQLSRSVDVLIDGTTRLTLTLIVVTAKSNPLTGVSAEQLLSTMSADEVTKLVSAKTLEMRLGQDEFSFDDAMRKNLYLFWDGYVVLVH